MWPPMQECELFLFAPARTTAVGSPKPSCFMREWPGVTSTNCCLGSVALQDVTSLPGIGFNDGAMRIAGRVITDAASACNQEPTAATLSVVPVLFIRRTHARGRAMIGDGAMDAN